MLNSIVIIFRTTDSYNNLKVGFVYIQNPASIIEMSTNIRYNFG